MSNSTDRAKADNRTVKCRECSACREFRTRNLVKLHAKPSLQCPACFGISVREPVPDVMELGVTTTINLDHSVNMHPASETPSIPLNQEENSGAEDRSQRISDEELGATAQIQRKEKNTVGHEYCELISSNKGNDTAVPRNRTSRRKSEISGEDPDGTKSQTGVPALTLDVAGDQADKKKEDFKPGSNLTEAMGYKLQIKSQFSAILNTTCEYCKRRQAAVVFFPCKHLLCCTKCAKTATYCAECRRPIMATQKVKRP